VWILAGSLAGCGGPREIPGGTRGRILVRGGTALREIQVTVYGNQADSPLALGISGEDGRFELRQPGTLEAFWLEPGDYRLTVESVGEVHLQWPPDYRDPQQTPLRPSVASRDHELLVEVPSPAE